MRKDSESYSMTFDEIKAQFNILDIAGRLGLKLTRTSTAEYRGVSPAPGPHNTNDALSVDTIQGIWHDFSANVGGSVLDLVAYVKFGGIAPDRLKQAAEWITGETCDSKASREYLACREHFTSLVEEAHATLLTETDTPEVQQTLDYIHTRRISDETISRFKLGVANVPLSENGKHVRELRLICPYLDGYGNPVYMISRQLPFVEHAPGFEGRKYSKHPANAFVKNSLFGLNTLPVKDSDCDTLIIGEGLFDCLSLAQAGYPVLSAISGSFGRENEEKLIAQAKRFRRVVFTYDCDTNLAGQNFTCRLGRLFLKEKLNFSVIPNFGEGNKDVSDYFTNGGDIQELLATAENGYVFMSRFAFWLKTVQPARKFSELSPNDKATALAEVKKFVHTLLTFLPETQSADLFGGDMRKILDALKENYPAGKIETFAQGMTRDELLRLWRDEFLEGKHIFFHGSIKGGSYYEFHPAGFWLRMTDAALKSEISAHFKHEKSNSDIRALTEMVQNMTARKLMPRFNAKRLWLFRNGAFQLDSGTLREAQPEDYLTWQVNYEYDATAECPTFDSFMAEIACHEPSRLATLDDLLGYTLFENNRLEKMFVLVGEGANGKSTFLHALEDLVQDKDKRSVTTVALRDLRQPTSVALLSGSILNVCFDLDSNLHGCEAILRSITSGDSVNANFKFLDGFSFEPRCKLVGATNSMLRLNDASEAMRRRLVFVKFANCFKGRADTHLREKLKAERPGIFNRAYRAYQALLEREKELGNDAIRLCIDQGESLSEFTELASPVVAFWREVSEEYISRGEIKKAEIFSEYVAFCERNDRKPGGESNFHKELKRVAADDGISIVDVRHRDGKGRIYYSQFTVTNELLKKVIDAADAGTLELTDE